MGIAAAVNQFKFPNIVAETEGMEYEEWKKLRMGFIGGSDAAAVIGLSRYKTPVSVYFSKTEELQEDFSDRSLKKMEMGHLMEPVIAMKFAEVTGKHVVRQSYFYSHPEHSFMGANIDFGIYGENAGLEVKNSAYRDDWKDGEVPDEYFIQCQHYMAVTGADRFYLAYLLEGWDFNYVTIQRDEVIINELIRREKEFWETHVARRQPPAFDGSESAKALLKLLYPAENESLEPAELTEEVDAMWEKEKEISEAIKNLTTQKDEIRNKISAMIGEHSTGISNKWVFSYKTVNRSGYTVEPASFRQLRAKARK